MASKTRIIILRMKGILYTLLFTALALILILLFVYMFFMKEDAVPNEISSVPTYSIHMNSVSMDPLFNILS